MPQQETSVSHPWRRRRPSCLTLPCYPTYRCLVIDLPAFHQSFPLSSVRHPGSCEFVGCSKSPVSLAPSLWRSSARSCTDTL
mmetsp:Transcript_46256/g.94583  ORF Transcript_46256/g.94583 Transcript_46256/m.94583 type:complete len:82 (-) Transcript_46256:24-269(-)